MSRSPARASLVAIALGLAVIVVTAIPGRAADRNPADMLLDRARAAVRNYEFRAQVRIWWADAHGGQARTIDVAASGGALEIDHGRVLHDGGRAWMWTDRQWTTLWSDTDDVRAPSVGSKYRIERSAGAPVVGRPTELLDIRSRHRKVEQISFDHETGLVVRRDRFDGTGRPSLRMEFLTLTGLRHRHGAIDAPGVGSDAPGRRVRVPSGAVRSLSNGFVLVDARATAEHATQLRYSDGVFEASVFTQPGPIDWGSLPKDGRDVSYGPVRVRTYASPSGTVIVWQSGQQVMTCVTDATRADQADLVTALTRHGDGGWTEVVKFVTGPFRWS